MVETFKNDFKLSAIAINSGRGPCTPDIVKDICAGSYQIILVSPEMLVSRRFMNDILRNPNFLSRVYAIVIDEAHCISHWGAAFRKKYGTLGVVRAFLPKPTPVIAVSASLTPRVCRDIAQKLQFPRGYLFKNLGNDRPNVSLVVRAIHNPLHSYTDLDFLIPANVTQHEDLKKTWIYADNIDVGAAIIDHLRALLPDHLHPVIRPYNAVHSVDYRTVAMEQFKSGKIRVLVCTDAAGMGCNIPDIDIIVQWKLPGKLSSFVQRAGRAARGPNTTGLSVLLVEPTVYSIRSAQPKNRARGKKKPAAAQPTGSQVDATMPTSLEQSQGRDYARSHGRFRGARNSNDALPGTLPDDPPFSEDDETEGAYLFVQTTSCRRNVLRKVFVNPAPHPVVPCCDICDPSLLDLVRPGLRPKSSMKKLTYSKRPNPAIIAALSAWRQKVMIEDHHPRFLPASSILPEEAIDKIACLSPCTETAVKGYLLPQWILWSVYGSDVTAVVMSSLEVSPSVTIPSPATNHQHEDRHAATNPPTEPAPRRQKRARRAATQSDAQSPRNANADPPTWSQTQSPHLPLSQPTFIPSDLPFAPPEPDARRQKRARPTATHSNAQSPRNANVQPPSWSQTQSPHLPLSRPVYIPSDMPFASTEQDPGRQERARHAATHNNAQSPRSATAGAPSWTQTQIPNWGSPLSQPPLVVPGNGRSIGNLRADAALYSHAGVHHPPAQPTPLHPLPTLASYVKPTSDVNAHTSSFNRALNA